MANNIINELPPFYEGHEKIVVPVMFYVDGNTGKRVFDEEAMLEAFSVELEQLQIEENAK